jgi:methanogenic corrinoid protein MtbC1
VTKGVLDIAAVERDVGLSKEVLRVWERRYGFPAPTRDLHGERLYSAAQVERLRVVKRLMDQGHRPGRLLSAPEHELAALSQARPATAPAQAVDGQVAELLALVRRHAAEAFVQALRQRLARQGLRSFVLDTIAPLTVAVGDAWQHGELQIYEEHLYTELAERVLQQAIAAVPGSAAPKLLLTTLPNEPHAMGLLMVEAMFALEGARCVSLGTQTPLTTIAPAARAHAADVVALSFSAAFPARQVAPLLQQLRATLPARVALWVGGAGARRAQGVDGVRVMDALDAAADAVADWRRAVSSPASASPPKAPATSDRGGRSSPARARRAPSPRE